MKNITEIEAERLAWSLKTFPDATAESSLLKLREEIMEIEEALNDGTDPTEEFADALICLFDSAGRSGIVPDEIFKAVEIKFEKNKKREWKKNPQRRESNDKQSRDIFRRLFGNYANFT